MSRKRRRRKKERQKEQAGPSGASPGPVAGSAPPAVDPEGPACVEPEPVKPAGAAVEAERRALPRPRLPRWLRLAVVVLIHLGAVAVVVLYAGYYGPLRITGFDAICHPAERVVIRAKAERDGPAFVNPDVSGLEIEFILTPVSRELPRPRMAGPGAVAFLPEGEVVGRATTDSDGFASLEVDAPKLEGNYFYGLRVPDASLGDLKYPRSYTVLAVTAAQRPILVSDIDNTICVTDLTNLNADRPWEVRPLDDAPEVLSTLARKAQIVYLTARPYTFTERSRNWLAAHRFPPGPIFFRDLSELLPGQPTESGFKKDLLAEKLRPGFSRLLWGFGNIEGDLEAYRASGMSTILIRPQKPGIVEGIDSAHAVESWAEIPALVDPTL